MNDNGAEGAKIADTSQLYDIAAFNTYCSKVCNSFSILHLNARSLCNKVDEVECFVNSLGMKFDVLAFTETWFRNHDVCLNGYHCEYVNRPQKTGGGVAIYIKNSVAFKLIEELSSSAPDYECIARSCRGILVVLLYRPPDGKKCTFFEFVCSVSHYVS